jgi:hypothetical protein
VIAPQRARRSCRVKLWIGWLAMIFVAVNGGERVFKL